MTEKRRRLGELLVDAGLLSRLQLDQALQAQKIFGGRLGTNFIEMRVVSDETLAEFLAQQLNVPRAPYRQMDDVSREVLELIPAKAAQRLCILPIELEGDDLLLAMMDPTDDRVIRRLEKNLARKIKPMVATEIEIRYFLEKHYGIPREMRHIQLMEQENKQTTSPLDLEEELERRMGIGESINFFFSHIGTLEKIPVRVSDQDVMKENFNPSLSFLYHQVDGIMNLGELLSISPLPRIMTLRGFVCLAAEKMIRFEE